uniref:p0660F12.10 protein n=3 Tax=Oryza TaxID=4527 RepID=Q94CR8_ORYSJ|nr:P0660F12.10 [Oryza sativa Japonica Group]
MSTSEEAGLPDPATAASSLVDCRLPGREGCEPLHSSSPLSSHLHVDPVVALFGSTTLLSTVFLTRSPCRSPPLGARMGRARAAAWAPKPRRRKAWAMAKYGDDGSKAQTMARYGVQMGNEQRCQKEIEDTKHGLESGSITYDPAKLKFSDDIKDSR